MTSASNGSISLQQSVTPTKPPSCGFAQLVTEKSKDHTSWRREDLNLRPSGYERGPRVGRSWSQPVRMPLTWAPLIPSLVAVGRRWTPLVEVSLSTHCRRHMDSVGIIEFLGSVRLYFTM